MAIMLSLTEVAECTGEGMGREMSYNAVCLLRIIFKEMELKLNSVTKVFVSYTRRVLNKVL